MSGPPDSMLIDSKTMIWLHASSRSNLLKLLLTKIDIYVSALSVYEVMSAFIYYKLGDPRSHMARLEKIYHIVYPDREIISTASRINADLMYHSDPRNDIDVIVAATGITRNLTLVTIGPGTYDVFKKYGLSVMDMEKVVKRVESGVGRKAMVGD